MVTALEMLAPAMLFVLKEISIQRMLHDVCLIPVHVRGVDNTWADALSRCWTEHKYKWILREMDMAKRLHVTLPKEWWWQCSDEWMRQL